MTWYGVFSSVSSQCDSRSTFAVAVLYVIALYIGPRYNGTGLYCHRGVLHTKDSPDFILLSQSYKTSEVFVPTCGSAFPSANVIFKLKRSGMIEYDVSCIWDKLQPIATTKGNGGIKESGGQRNQSESSQCMELGRLSVSPKQHCWKFGTCKCMFFFCISLQYLLFG